MMENKDLDKIVKSINEWSEITELYKNNIINESTVLDLLMDRNCFELSYDEINKWYDLYKDDTNLMIHIYAGIVNQKLCFYLIDSTNDGNQNFEGNILKKELYPKYISEELEECINYNVAKERIKAWLEFKALWLRKAKKDVFFRLIEIKYQDYIDIKLTKRESCKNFLALKFSEELDIENVKLNVEIIVVNDKTSKNIAADYSSPRPPFSADIHMGENYQLLWMNNSLDLNDI